MIDYPSLIGPIARRFWGEPTSKSATELRFGAHGSKVVSLEAGTWYDHESDEGGGLIDLVRTNIPESGNGAISRFLEEFDVEPYEPPEVPAFTLPITKRILAEYNYQDAAGTLVYTVVRYEPREFRQKRLENGKTVWNIKGITPVPFRLPEIQARASEPVFIAEGEKCVLELEKHGFLATCNSGGAGKWTDNHAKWLEGRKVVILPDNDEVGKKHAQSIVRSLQSKARIKLVELPGLEPKGDIVDWLKDHDITEFTSLVKATVETLGVETTLPVLSITDIFNLPPTTWLLEDLIPERSMTLIYGPPGSGKTFFALDVCLSIAHGIQWLEKSEVRQGIVIYIAGEGVGGLRKRLRAWHEQRHLEPREGFYVIPQAVGLLEEGMIDTLIEDIRLIAREKPVRAVVFDTLARCMRADENSAQDMGDAVAAMDRVRTALECAVIPIHHAGKDLSRGARGSTALIGAVDVSILVRRTDKLLEITIEKQKDAEALEPFVLESKVVQFAVGFEDAETSLVLESTSGAITKGKGIRLTGTQKVVYDALLEAMLLHGHRPGGNFDGIRVGEDQWREIAKGMQLSDGGPEAQRKAFYRAARELVTKHIISKKDGFIGLLERDIERDIMRDMADRQITAEIQEF